MTTSSEEWRPIPGYEGVYEVSDRGRVRSFDRTSYRASGPIHIRGKILRAQTNKKTGHLRLHLRRDGVARLWGVHQLVLLGFVGPAPRGMEGCHNDGVPTNNRLENLRWDTRKANVADAIRHGTFSYRTGKFLSHCRRGHLKDGDNLYITSAGDRDCVACRKIRSARQVERAREKRESHRA
jgi:hypothetical protein